MIKSDAYLLQILRKELPPLTDDNAAQVKSCILTLEEEIDSLERQVPVFEVFEAILKNLQRTLAALKTTLALCRAVVAPIHRLPQELLIAIFQYCIHENDSSLEDYSSPACLGDGDNVRWVLSRVCRSWKYVLEGTPTLWTNLVISPDTRPLTQPLKLYLSLSAERPLSVTIFELDSYTYPARGEPKFRDNWCTTFWEALSLTSHRWQCLRIDCFYTSVKDVIMHLVPSMPSRLLLLEEVCLQSKIASDDFDLDDPTGQEWSWFRDAPRLKRAKLRPSDDWSCAWYPPTLTHLSTEQDNGLMLESVLSFPDLQELIFEYEFCTEPPDLKPVYHTNLKNLLCCAVTLSYLTLPALECLAVIPYEGNRTRDYQDMVDNVAALIRRSKCRITDLHILDTCTSLENHCSCTKLLALLAPTLVVLGLDPSYSLTTQEIIRSLTRTESSSGSLPCLEYLKFSLHGRYKEQDPVGFDSFVDTFTTTLVSLRDERLAKKWHAPLLKQVSVICENDTIIARLRTACLDSLSSRGLEVGYAREPWTGVFSFVQWHTTWYDKIRR